MTISTSWLGLSNKVMRTLLTIAMVAFWTACADDSQNIGPDADAASAGKGKGGSGGTSDVADFIISAPTVTTVGQSQIWEYTITSTGKAISHFILNLNNCLSSSARIAMISNVTVNGAEVPISDSEGNTGCDPYKVTNNFVKFDNLGTAKTYVVSFTLNGIYTQVPTTAWIKSGTTCHTFTTVIGPGCPESICSLSQGYYFAGGTENNGAAEVWTSVGGINLGGNNYTYEEGTALWAVTGLDKLSHVRAFFQYGAITLSGTDYSADANLAAAMATIEAYFSGKPELTPTNAGTCTLKPNQQCNWAYNTTYPSDDLLKTASGFIGDWIQANHCSE